jgi:hypothetical protein
VLALFMDASVQVTSTRHLGTSMPSRGRPPHHYEVYGGEAFRQVMDETVAWYRTHLPAR